MKYINKKIIKSIAVFACVAGLLLSFAGCSGITGNKKQEEKTQKSCTVSGSVITESQNAISSERTATTSFSIPEGAEYCLRAYWGQTDPKANMFNIDIDSETIGTFDSDTMKYSIELIKAGTWSIELCMVKDSVDFVIAQRMVEVAESLADLTDANLFIIADFDYFTNSKAESDEIVTSPINLEITKDPDSTDISAVKWVWKNINNSTTPFTKISTWFEKLTDDPESPNYQAYPKTITKNFVDNKVTFTFEEVPTWSYEVSLIIVKSNGDEYVFDEVVNVFQNFTTDTWYGDSMHLKKDSSTGKYLFYVSDRLLEDIPKKENYAEITESNTPYVLYSDYEREAYYFVSKNGNGVFNYDEELDDGVIGTQVFSTIDGEEKIEKPVSVGSNFCFGDNKIYILETQKESEFSPLSSIILKKCKKSYSGYTKEGTGISLLEKLTDFISDADPEVYDVGQITYSNGFICFQWLCYESGEKVYNFAVVDAVSGELVNSQFTVSNLLPGIVVNTKKTDVNIQGEPNTKYEGYLYYYDKVNYSSPESLKEIAITIKSNIVENTETLDSVTFGSSIPVLELKAENLKSNSTDEDIEYGKLRFGDMILQDDYLYVLVRSSGRIELNSDEYSEEPVNLYQSTGGVLRFSVSESDGRLTQENWIINSESKKLLGAYTRTITEEDNYYKYNSQDWTYYPYTNVCALQPPLDSTQVYFYGPQRFIARKPDALVIADDGGYIEDDDESSSSLTAKNRVVTVNLTDLSLSAVDVKATFTSTFTMASSGYAYID